MSAPGLAALALAALVGSAAQSATGFGVALPLAPVAFALLAPADAVITVVAASLAHNALVLGTRHRRLELRGADGLLLVVAAVPGLAAGALIVQTVPKAPMQLAVGAAILAAIAFRLHEPGRHAGRLAGVPAGLIAGTLTTTVGINGPPLVIWLRARGATLTELRDTLAVVFLALNLAALGALSAGDGAIPGAAIPVLAGGLLAGHVLGVRAHERLPEQTLSRVLAGVLALAASASIVGGAAGLVS